MFAHGKHESQYKHLSNKTHIDYGSHGDFLRTKDGKNTILYTQHEFYEYAQAILYLGDWFRIVWELSQHKYLSQLETIEITDNKSSVKAIVRFFKSSKSIQIG